MKKQKIDRDAFNIKPELPFELRTTDFEAAMQDIYDFFYDVNALLRKKGLRRLDDTLRPAAMSGILSDMLSASLASHSRSLVENRFFNGHPDLIVQGRYKGDSVKAGEFGVEIKCTRKKGGAVDTHGARNQWLCVFVYATDQTTEPADDRLPMRFTEIYLAQVTTADFRKNARSELGTRTATLDKAGITKFRENWIYREPIVSTSKAPKKRGNPT